MVKLENREYEGKLFFGLEFENHPEVVYLETEKLRKKAIKNYKKGKVAYSYKRDYFKGLPFYTELNF